MSAAPQFQALWEQQNQYPDGNVYMISQTNWTGCTHFTGIGSTGSFSNGYIPMFAVIGSNNECFYNNNSFSAVAGALTEAIESFGLNAMFSANVTEGPAQLGVYFQNTSTPANGIETFEWDLDGDGITDSTVEDPYFLYTEMGSYDVTLTITMDGETSTLTQEDYINVTDASNVNGVVSGIWTEDVGVYTITGDIIIPTGSDLAIGPGVELDFADGTSFDIMGKIDTTMPVETEDPIIMSSSTVWNGITISGTMEDNVLMNCDISNTSVCAIMVEPDSKVDIIGNRIHDNESTSYGIITIDNSPDVIISQNIIANNISQNATGGIKCMASPITISNNIIVNNTGTFSALMLNDYSDIVFENNTVANNESSNGTPYLFYFFQSFPTLVNNIIIDNGTPFFAPFGDPEVNYTCITGGFTGTGNIDEDPLFEAPSAGDGVDYDGLNASWWLQAGSPCIDAGNPDIAYNDPDGSRNDMGAFGGPEAMEVPVGNDDDPITIVANSNVNIYPNPFNPQTSIALNLTQSDQQNPVSVEVYNVKGQLVRTLVKNEIITNNSVIWDGTDNNGRHTSSGIYFTKVNTQSTTITKKMILLK